MNLPSDNSTNAVLRHVYSIAGTILFIGAAAAVVPQDSIQPILDKLHVIGDDVGKLIGDFKALMVLVGPIILALTAKSAGAAASFQTFLKKMRAVSSAPESVQKDQIVNAMANTVAVVAADPAQPTTTNTKAAIIAAAGSLPEVADKIRVNDQDIVAAAKSIVATDKIVAQ